MSATIIKLQYVQHYAAAGAICKSLCATVCQWCQCSLEGVCLCVCMCVCVCVCVRVRVCVGGWVG